MDEWINQCDIYRHTMYSQHSAIKCNELLLQQYLKEAQSRREFSEGVDRNILNSNYGRDYMNSTFIEIHRAIHKLGGAVIFLYDNFLHYTES